MAVFLQRRAAPCSIANNRVKILREKGVEICAGHIARDVAKTGMRGKRAAAILPAWDHHIAPIRLEDSNRGSIELAESHLCQTPSEECHACALWADGGERPAN